MNNRGSILSHLSVDIGLSAYVSVQWSTFGLSNDLNPLLHSQLLSLDFGQDVELILLCRLILNLTGAAFIKQLIKPTKLKHHCM